MVCNWFHRRLAVTSCARDGRGCAPTSVARTGANQNLLMWLLSMNRWTRWDHECQTDSLSPPLSIDHPFDGDVEPIHTRSERYARHLPPPSVRMKQRAGISTVQPRTQRLGVDSRGVGHQDFCSGRAWRQFGPNGGWAGECEEPSYASSPSRKPLRLGLRLRGIS